MTILLTICISAFLVRVFSVIRYEVKKKNYLKIEKKKFLFLLNLFTFPKNKSIIHEFDPWFNYRTTKYLVESDEGLYGLWNWFDSESWYPLGR